MRISDWSSDVCSSDLLGQVFGTWGWDNSRYFELPFLGPSTLRDAFGLGGEFLFAPSGINIVFKKPEQYAVLGLYLIDLRAGALAGEKLLRGDRTSGEEGEGASVRVDLGGGRTIKQK